MGGAGEGRLQRILCVCNCTRKFTESWALFVGDELMAINSKTVTSSSISSCAKNGATRRHRCQELYPDIFQLWARVDVLKINFVHVFTSIALAYIYIYIYMYIYICIYIHT